MKAIYTSTRVGTLARVFSKKDRSAAQMARLAVLFEDLRVEILGMSMTPEMPFLADCSYRYRELYFIRRSTATLYEFVHALGQIEKTEEFQSWTLTAEESVIWADARDQLKTHQKFYTTIRNYIGGHFGQQAAEKAVNHLRSETVGRIELRSYGGTGGATLHFAGEIAATTLNKLCEGKTIEERAGILMTRLRDSYMLAARATNIVARHYFWPRFGKG